MTTSSLPLSVLDLSPIPSGATASDALGHSIALAQHAESLGLHRYWLAEHHNAGSLASSAPEIMIGRIAAATQSLRVGAGGIMLPNHSPLKVAEVFRVLHALFPGRIDLGLGRAPGTDGRTAIALRSRSAGIEFPEQVDELRRYLDDEGDSSPRNAFAMSIRAIPLGVPAPDLWILGSSDFGALYAAEHGLPFAFAHHINPDDAVSASRLYRERFRPSKDLPGPRSIVTVSALVAADAEGGRDLVACARLSLLRFARGQRDLPVPSAEEAHAHDWTDEDRALVHGSDRRNFVGTVDQVRAPLLELLQETQADELMVMSHCHDQAARKNGYTLLQDMLRR